MNKIMSMIIIISFSLLYAKELSTIEETKKQCKVSVEKIKYGNIKKAFDELKPYWPIPIAEIDNVAYQTKSQLDRMEKRFGNAVGTDFVETKKAGNSFVKHTYLIKYENTSIRFICIYYKPKKKWKINSIFWDDKIKLLFK